MTQPNQQDDTKAAIGFAVVAAAVAGFAGVIVAAVAVGLERAWSRRDGGRTLRGAQRRDRYEDALAWLAQDRGRRDAYRQRRREWWNGGAVGEPPTAPRTGVRVGGLLRRLAAKAYVGAHNFRTGFGEGWRAGQVTRRAGGRFRDVVRSRPAADEGDDANWCPRCGGLKERWAWYCEACDLDPVPDPVPDPAPAPLPRRPAPTPPTQSDDLDHDDPAPPPGNQPNPNNPPTREGDPTMGSPQGDTNVAVMLGHLAGIKEQLRKLDDINDQLSAQRDELARLVQEAAEFAELTGQTNQTRQALDAADGVATQLGQQVGAVSESVTEANDQIDSAVDGLRPVQHAEDELAAAGADGRAVAPAGAGA